MGGAERIVFALGALGEARKARALAQGADAVAAAGEDLVRIGLVADIPDQDVVGGLEDVVQGDRQLDHAQARAQMAAGVRDRVDHLGTQLIGELAQLARLQGAQVGGNVDGVEQWSFRHDGKGRIPRTI